MGTKGKEKKLNGIQSLILLLLIIASVTACIHLKTGGLIIGLLFNWVIIYLFCLGNRSDYERILDGAFDALKVGVLDCILRLFAGGIHSAPRDDAGGLCDQHCELFFSRVPCSDRPLDGTHVLGEENCPGDPARMH